MKPRVKSDSAAAFHRCRASSLKSGCPSACEMAGSNRTVARFFVRGVHLIGMLSTQLFWGFNPNAPIGG